MNRRAFLGIAAALSGRLALRSARAQTDAPIASVREESAMPTFPIVDTHVHLWDPQHLRYPWIERSELLNRPYLLKDFDEAVRPVKVERIVFVQAACLPEQSMDEVAWVSGLAKTDPRIEGIVAHAPLEQGDAVLPTLEALARNPLMRGIRRMTAGEQDPEFCLQPGFVEGVQLLERVNFTCDLGIHRGQIEVSAELARRCPNVRFMLCHIGVPDIKNSQLDPWRDHLRELAALPNVYCKVSGVATAADHAQWKPEDLEPAIDHVIECFGFERCAFGSDWPVMLLATDYPRWVEALAAAVKGCSDRERQRLFRDTAVEFYRLPAKPPAA